MVKATPGYQTKTETILSCGPALQLRSLVDRNQFSDPDGAAALAGISEEAWPLFGVLWPSGRVLAQAMVSEPLAGRRILEVGCGLALASLVLHRRGGLVTASDCHPLVPEFLAQNLALNALGALPYRVANWARPDPTLGQFELIIGSDVLYDHGQPEVLSRFIDAHLAPGGKVVLVDPNRGHRAKFTRDMEALGFSLAWTAVEAAPELYERFRGRVLRYSR